MVFCVELFHSLFVRPRRKVHAEDAICPHGQFLVEAYMQKMVISACVAQSPISRRLLRTAVRAVASAWMGTSLCVVAISCKGRDVLVPIVDAGNDQNDDDAGTGLDAGHVDPTDAGNNNDDAGTIESDAGLIEPIDAGNANDDDAGVPATEIDAGIDPNADAGNDPPSLDDLLEALDGGPLGESLSCLPEERPDLSITGLLSAFDFSLYTGRAEEGVVCGESLCTDGNACCELCGAAACGEGDTCPTGLRTIRCDGPEECSRSDDEVCCYTLQGTECRAAADCDLDIGQLLLDVAQTAGDVADLRDGGSLADLGDGGGGILPNNDGDGGILDNLTGLLDEGVPVCRSTFADCSILSGEVCCTSARMVSVDLGICLPALVCLDGQFGQ